MSRVLMHIDGRRCAFFLFDRWLLICALLFFLGELDNGESHKRLNTNCILLLQIRHRTHEQTLTRRDDYMTCAVVRKSRLGSIYTCPLVAAFSHIRWCCRIAFHDLLCTPSFPFFEVLYLFVHLSTQTSSHCLYFIINHFCIFCL